MILRIFKVEIFPELQADFERDFALISVQSVLNQQGCVSCQVGKPISAKSAVYMMLTMWEDPKSLLEFTGEDFKQAIIPAGMGKYVKACSVEHYLSTEPYRRRSPRTTFSLENP
ncbi:MAG: antibiotic biosynthesis monooxygenase [Limnothrix sp.]